MPITNDVTSEEEKRKLQLPSSKPKKIEEKNLKKKSKKKYHFPNFLSPETKCHKMQVILYRVSKSVTNPPLNE